MSNEYKIDRLLDIMQLEDDQIDRLCAELPRVIKYAKSVRDLIQSAVGTTDSEQIASAIQFISPLTWIDDGKTEITVTAILHDEQSIKFEVGEKK